MSKENLPVIEVVPVIQGEGRSTGEPMILIRLTKCNLNCMFRGSICDASETSWLHDPMKGSKYSLSDIEDVILANPQIKKVMITGGNPTYQPNEFIEIAKLAKHHGMGVEIEDNGTTYLPIFKGLIDLVSMSPKLSNSIPEVGHFVSDLGREITQADREKHIRAMGNLPSMRQWILNFDYQLKFVISEESDIQEALSMTTAMGADIDKVYFMPEGATRDQLTFRRKWLYEKCIELGIKYTDRLHIVVYNDKKGV